MPHSTNKRPYAEFRDGSDAQPVHTLEKEQLGAQETLDNISTSHSDTGAYTESHEAAEQGKTGALK